MSVIARGSVLSGSAPSSGATSDQTKVSDGLSVQLNLAPIGRRIFAYMIDLGIACAPLYVLIIVLAIVFAISAGVIGTFFSGGDRGLALGILASVALLSLIAVLGTFHAYFVYFEYKTGTTPGKKMLGLKVISLDGSRLSLKACIMRDLARYIDCFLVFPGLLCICLTGRRQRLGDLMVGSVVTYSKHEEQKSSFLYVPQDAFIYLQSELKPESLPEGMRDRFLAYAFRRFVNKDPAAQSISEERPWVEMIRSKMSPEKVASVSSEDLLRFYAELCFKEKNAKLRKKGR